MFSLVAIFEKDTTNRGRGLKRERREGIVKLET